MIYNKYGELYLMFGIFLLSLLISLEFWWEFLLCTILGDISILLFIYKFKDALGKDGEA